MDIGCQNNHDEYSCFSPTMQRAQYFLISSYDAVNSLVLQMLSRNFWLSGYEVGDFNAGSSHF